MWSEGTDAPRPAGARPDGAAYPTGGDWAEKYLQLLADVLGDKIRYGATARPASPARAGTASSSGRDEQPFTVHIQLADGREELGRPERSTWPKRPLGGIRAESELSCVCGRQFLRRKEVVLTSRADRPPRRASG